MSNSTRRSFLKRSTGTPDRLALAGGGSSAAGATPALPIDACSCRARRERPPALPSSPPARLAAAALSGTSEHPPVGLIANPTSSPPRETVMAFVRDAARGEVTVLSGTREVTYRDPALAKRMLDAAP